MFPFDLLVSPTAKIKLIIAGVILAVVTTLGITAYVYWNYSQNKIATLEANQAKLDLVVDEQHKTIDVIQQNIKDQGKVIDELQTNTAETKKDYDKVLTVLAKHDLNKIAKNKPVLLEQHMNDATKDVIRCFEIATGAKVTKDEKNNQCPSLIIPSS